MIYLNQLPEVIPKVLACDLETSGHGPHSDRKDAGLSPYLGKILSIAFSDGTDTWIITEDFDRAIPLFTNPFTVIIFQNASFDLAWIQYHLNTTVSWIYDTMLAEQLLIGGRRIPASLLDIIARRCGKVINKDTREEFFNHPGFDVLPMTPSQEKYIVDDVLYLPEIRAQQIKDLKDAGMFEVFKLELNTVRAVVALELGGISFDEDLWYEQVKDYNAIIEHCETELYAAIGNFVVKVPRVRKGESVVDEIPACDINFRSSQQLLALFKQRYNLEISSTRAPLLNDIVEGRYIVDSSVDPAVVEFIHLLLEIRKWNKRKGYDYPQYINPVTGKIHPSFRQIGAATGRFSCAKPNMQNVPRPGHAMFPLLKDGEPTLIHEPNMRHLFIADDKDFVIIRADYAQQEPRILAHMSGDPVMVADCNADDVYLEFGKSLFGRAIDKDSDERHIAKTFVLAVGYGAMPKKLSETTGKPRKECAALRLKIRSRFSVMASYADKMRQQADRNHFVTTETGRRRYFEGNEAYMQAPNTPIQGTAADMVKLALSNVHKFLTVQTKCGRIHSNSRVWSTVHDEIEIHCHKDDADYLLEETCRIMEEAGRTLCPSVKHRASAEYAYRWDK